jgi:regulator of protease activity HflC (stomatin/prohibitin superfamily)
MTMRKLKGRKRARELQFGLRKAVAAKTLDELLGDKASLDGDLFAYVRGRVADLGIEVLGVGVKDVILPGEMKEILNSVVQAAKAAEANVIRRREETNATRSALACNGRLFFAERRSILAPCNTSTPFSPASFPR